MKDTARNKLCTKSFVRNENSSYGTAADLWRSKTSPYVYMYIPSVYLCRPTWLHFREYDAGYEPARFEYPQVCDSQQWYRSRVKGPRGTRSNSVPRYALSNEESFLSIYFRWISDDFIKLASCRAITDLGSVCCDTCNSLRHRAITDNKGKPKNQETLRNNWDTATSANISFVKWETGLIHF